MGRIKSSINVAFSGNGFVWSLIRVDLGENGCFRPGSRRYRPTPTQLLSSYDAGVLPASFDVVVSCEPPLRLTTLQAAAYLSWLSSRVASAAPAASFKSVNRRSARWNP